MGCSARWAPWVVPSWWPPPVRWVSAGGAVGGGGGASPPLDSAAACSRCTDRRWGRRRGRCSLDRITITMSSAVSSAAEAGPAAVVPPAATVQTPRVFFQSPPAPPAEAARQRLEEDGVEEEEVDAAAAEAAAAQRQQQQRRQQQGKVTVKYDRKELRKRLVLEEWVVEQLSALYGCEEEEMPEVEIDIDDLLDANSEEERAFKLQESLVDCYKPTEEFVKELLTRIRGMRKLSPPQKKAT